MNPPNREPQPGDCVKVRPPGHKGRAMEGRVKEIRITRDKHGNIETLYVVCYWSGGGCALGYFTEDKLKVVECTSDWRIPWPLPEACQ